MGFPAELPVDRVILIQNPGQHAERNQETKKCLKDFFKPPSQECIVFPPCTQYLLRTDYVLDIVEGDFNSLPSNKPGIYSRKSIR